MPLTKGVLGAGMAVTMLLTEWTEGRHQHQQGLAVPVILTVGPALTQVTGGTVEAPATALIGQAAQTGGVGGAGQRAVGLQEEEGDLTATRHSSPIPQESELTVPRARGAIELASDLHSILVASPGQWEEATGAGALQTPCLLLLLSHPASHLFHVLSVRASGHPGQDMEALGPSPHSHIFGPRATWSSWQQRVDEASVDQGHICFRAGGQGDSCTSDNGDLVRLRGVGWLLEGEQVQAREEALGDTSLQGSDEDGCWPPPAHSA